MRVRSWADVAGSRVQLYVRVASSAPASGPLGGCRAAPAAHARRPGDSRRIGRTCLPRHEILDGSTPTLERSRCPIGAAAGSLAGLRRVAGTRVVALTPIAASSLARCLVCRNGVACLLLIAHAVGGVEQVGGDEVRSLHGVNAQVGLKPHVMGHVPTNQPTGAHSGCPQLVVNMSWEQTPPVCIAKPATQVAIVPWLSTAILASSSRQPAMAVGGRPSPSMEPKPHAVTASAAHNTALNGGGDICWVVEEMCAREASRSRGG
eukprot:scaffold12030_cov66-Phaeocystis_antarctica.AAC.3